MRSLYSAAGVLRYMYMHLRTVKEEYMLVFSNKKTSEMAGRLRDLYYSVLRRVCFVYLSIVYF